MTDGTNETRNELANTPLSDVPVTYKTLQVLHQGPSVPTRYKKSKTGVNDMYAATLAGQELGIGWWTAIQELYLVNGQVSMSGKLMSALVHRHGHIIKLQVTDKKAVATGMRWHPQSQSFIEVGPTEFSAADAKRAGLDDKGTYKSYPRVMLGWRAISNLCRVHFADCLSGIGYVPEELDVQTDLEVEPLPETIEVEVDAPTEVEQASALLNDVLDAEIVAETEGKIDPALSEVENS